MQEVLYPRPRVAARFSAKCKATYDKVVAREKRKANKAKQKAKKAERKKNEVQKLLLSENFRRRLPGPPKDKGLKQAQALSNLNRAPSIAVFYQQNLDVKRTIDAMPD